MGRDNTSMGSFTQHVEAASRVRSKIDHQHLLIPTFAEVDIDPSLLRVRTVKVALIFISSARDVL